MKLLPDRVSKNLVLNIASSSLYDFLSQHTPKEAKVWVMMDSNLVAMLDNSPIPDGIGMFKSAVSSMNNDDYYTMLGICDGIAVYNQRHSYSDGNEELYSSASSVRDILTIIGDDDVLSWYYSQMEEFKNWLLARM